MQIQRTNEMKKKNNRKEKKTHNFMIHIVNKQTMEIAFIFKFFIIKMK